MTLPLTFAQIVAIAVTGAALVTDLQSRRIPNVLTFGSALAGLVYALLANGLPGLGWAAAGWVAGLAVFLPFFLLRGLGGGDVKLMAALGAWLGPVPIIWVGLFAAVAGGPLALVVAGLNGYVKQALSNIWGLFMFWRVAGMRPHPVLSLDSRAAGAPRLPYSLPILVGLMVTLWLR